MPEVPDKRYFSRISGQNRFKADSLEKVYRLLTVLAGMNGIPELQEKLALKGGTAIQGLVFNFRRLSIDIDLNYTGSVDKDKMQEDRKSISNDLSYLFRDLSYRADVPPSKYALDEFNLHYTNCFGGKDRIKLEINYLERLPVAGVIHGSMFHPFEDLGDIVVRSYRPEELFAGKMRALIVRGSPRDVFDACQIANHADTLDMVLFKKLALFYLSMHSGDVRKMDAESVNRVTDKDIENSLVPLL
jgi:predicted nucleotidyltransferase component of viral defense system